MLVAENAELMTAYSVVEVAEIVVIEVVVMAGSGVMAVVAVALVDIAGVGMAGPGDVEAAADGDEAEAADGDDDDDVEPRIADDDGAGEVDMAAVQLEADQTTMADYRTKDWEFDLDCSSCLVVNCE